MNSLISVICLTTKTVWKEGKKCALMCSFINKLVPELTNLAHFQKNYQNTRSHKICINSLLDITSYAISELSQRFGKHCQFTSHDISPFCQCTPVIFSAPVTFLAHMHFFTTSIAFIPHSPPK